MVFKTGDAVWYVLPKGYGRPEPLRLPGYVVRVTSRRIVVKLDGHRRPRNTLAKSLEARDGSA